MKKCSILLVFSLEASKRMAVLRILTFSFLLCALVKGEFDNNLTDNSNKDNNFETQLLKQEYPITWNSYNIIATSVALVVVAAGVTAFVALIWPLIAYKVCYFLGSCDQSFFTYVDRFVVSEMNLDKFRQKRALENLGPILQALASAYEKYGSQQKKTPKLLNFYKK